MPTYRPDLADVLEAHARRALRATYGVQNNDGTPAVPLRPVDGAAHAAYVTAFHYLWTLSRCPGPTMQEASPIQRSPEAVWRNPKGAPWARVDLAKLLQRHGERAERAAMREGVRHDGNSGACWDAADAARKHKLAVLGLRDAS